MLKITLHRDERPVRMVLEGRLAGAWVDEVRQAWQRVPKPEGESVIVDLDGIHYVDVAGKELLRSMWRDGARLRGTGCCTRFIIDEIVKGRCESA